MILLPPNFSRMAAQSTIMAIDIAGDIRGR